MASSTSSEPATSPEPAPHRARTERSPDDLAAVLGRVIWPMIGDGGSCDLEVCATNKHEFDFSSSDRYCIRKIAARVAMKFGDEMDSCIEILSLQVAPSKPKLRMTRDGDESDDNDSQERFVSDNRTPEQISADAESFKKDTEIYEKEMAPLLAKGWRPDIRDDLWDRPRLSRVIQRFSCTRGNSKFVASWLVSWVISTLGNRELHKSIFVSLRCFDLPEVWMPIRKGPIYGDYEDMNEPWSYGYQVNCFSDKETELHLKQRVAAAADGRAYRERQEAALRALARTWDEAYATVGS